MIVSYKFNVRPSAAQKKILKRQIALCHDLQEHLLAYCFNELRSGNPVPTHFTLCNLLPTIKKVNADFKEVNAQVLQNVARRVALAMRKLVFRAEDYATIRKQLPSGLITYPQWGKGCRFGGDDDLEIYFDKVGFIGLTNPRRIKGSIKTVTIQRSKTDRWYVVFHADTEEKPVKKKTDIVGIDFGIKNFVTLSDGTMIPFPTQLSADRREIGKTLSKIKKASKRDKTKLKRRLNKIRERYKDRTTEFLNQTVHKLAAEYDGFCVEDINKEGMRGPAPLRNMVRAMPWRRFIGQLKTKCALEGKFFELVSPVNTSKTCSACQNIKEVLTLKERTYICEKCGLTLDRDINAALNILSLGTQAQA